MREATRSQAANRVFRRQQLVDATIESINTAGFAGTTLAKVAAIAGVSQGIVVFHFGTKERLLVATLQFLAEEYRDAWVAALAEAGDDPVERLCAFMLVDLWPRLVSRKKLAVWHAFYGEAKAHPIYLDICGVADDEHTKALHGLVADMTGLASPELERAVSVIEGLSDGIWLRMLLSYGGFDRASALAALSHQLECLFPDHTLEIRRCLEREQTRRTRRVRSSRNIRPRKRIRAA